jgi:hypothetical protein
MEDGLMDDDAAPPTLPWSSDHRLTRAIGRAAVARVWFGLPDNRPELRVHFELLNYDKTLDVAVTRYNEIIHVERFGELGLTDDRGYRDLTERALDKLAEDALAKARPAFIRAVA